MAERIVAIKKVELAGLSEGFGSESYAYVRPATYQDQIDISAQDFKNMKEDAQVAWQLAFVKERFVSGKINAFNGTEFELVDMTSEDTAASVGIADKLYSEIMGFDLDPKDIREAVNKAALQKTDEISTETTSSEKSQEKSKSE